MKKNELSVFTFPYRKTYYLTHPWKWWHDLYWGVRNFLHRGRYGYGYMDVWEWSYWWPKVGAEALRYMKDHGCGYPGYEPWDTPERWHAHLANVAEHLDWCVKSQDIDFHERENEYQKQMDEINERCKRIEKGEDGMWRSWLEMTDEDKEIRDKYFAREKELCEEYDNKRAEIFKEIGKNIQRYWD